MSFVKKDLEILEENYEVRAVNNFNSPNIQNSSKHSRSNVV